MKKGNNLNQKDSINDIEVIYDLYTDPELETDESIEQYLAENDIFKEENYENILRTIRKSIAQKKLEEGNSLAVKVQEIFKSSSDNDINFDTNGLAMGYRKLNKPASEDASNINSNEDKQKLEILKKLSQKKNDKSD